MNAHNFFYNERGTLRAPWRVFGFLVAVVVAVPVVGSLVVPGLSILVRAVGLRGDATEYWSDMLAILVATIFMLRVVEKRTWRDVWLDSTAFRPGLLIGGFVIGAVAIGIPVVVLISAHWLKLDATGAGSWLAAAVRLSVTLLPAALAEELLTRGYLLSALRDVWGWAWAVLATSVGFGLLHLRNPDATARSLGLVILAGVFLGAVVHATQSLYAAWMAHFAWNWMMAVVFHVAVSGIAMETPGYRYVDAGPDWATGGGWGPEGGIPAGGGMGLGMGLTYLYVRRRRGNQMSTVEPSPTFGA